MIKNILKTAFAACVAISCQAIQKDVVLNETVDDSLNMPEDFWLSGQATMRLDSLFNLVDQAHHQLNNGDTLGAELTYEYAFETLARFNLQEQSTLLRWSEYDSVLQQMNNDYEQIYENQQEITEAEEIREDITNFEEELFPDSILFGDETVVDTSSGFPITLNQKVRAAIKYFQTKGRPVFSIWLERSGKYENIVKEIFKKHDLPEELIYLAMIESGFNPSARSYARAVGMWQFISATGQHYGLRHNWWFDERRDYIKATEAAASHLKDLYEHFDEEWYLALAGYNCNPKRVKNNMRRYNTNDFWQLRRLPRQTRNYVPTFLAATIIAKNPKKFGFYVDKQPAIEVDTVQISESIDLNVIAKSVDTSYAFIKEINPAILKWVTPPGVDNFTIYLPKNTKEKFKKAYANIPDSEKRSWVRHHIKSGESLSAIAQKYHTSIAVLKSTNNLKSNFIRAGQNLLIPVPQNAAQAYASNVSDRPVSRKNYSKPVKAKENPVEYKSTDYIVKKGDTLGGIAELFNTRASKIRSWNGLRYGQHIYPNQKLIIFVPKEKSVVSSNPSKQSIVKADVSSGEYYTVRPGDTLWDISLKFGLSIADIKRINNKNSSTIRPGEQLKVSSN
ncbi:MAG: LysM peptidoglycan-binding domain-containing protein [Calditrichae bacterium]|nr:LysM peptidoglycan-binding domain-containing protein [Calditrichota bacterium]MCB9057174.1 LysM peptidoglycan-binding domain-containing protein [Calditrichia bacterium]